MDAAYLKNGSLVLSRNYPTPSPRRGEVLLKVKLAGICGTDLSLLAGYANFEGIPGHEFVAEVCSLGEEVSDHWLGKRVVAEINQWCGYCHYCCQKQFTHCQNRRVIGIRQHQGAFAEYLVANVQNLYLVPEEVSDQKAVFIEPLAASFRILEQISNRQYEQVLIVGGGRLGQLIARVFALQGKAVTVVVRHEQQRKLLIDLPVHCVNENEVDSQSADVVIESSGVKTGLESALHGVRSGGVCVLKSTYQRPIRLDLSHLVINEICLMGSRCGRYPIAIDALKHGQLDISSLIGHTFPLTQISHAFIHAKETKGAKIFIQPGE